MLYRDKDPRDMALTVTADNGQTLTRTRRWDSRNGARVILAATSADEGAAWQAPVQTVQC